MACAKLLIYNSHASLSGRGFGFQIFTAARQGDYMKKIIAQTFKNLSNSGYMLEKRRKYYYLISYNHLGGVSEIRLSCEQAKNFQIAIQNGYDSATILFLNTFC